MVNYLTNMTVQLLDKISDFKYYHWRKISTGRKRL